MPFLHPLYLLGLISIASPLILHFLSRKRAKVIPFSTLKFLIPYSTRRKFFLRLKEILLLMLRVLALLLLTLGIAQPVGKSLSRRTVTILVLDNSYSMNSHNEELWGKAKEKVREYIKKRGIFFLLTESKKEIYKGKEIKEALSSIKISYSPFLLSKFLEKAEKILNEFPSRDKRIVVISDMQKINFSGIKKNYLYPVIFDYVGDKSKYKNTSIEKVKLKTQGTRAIFEVTLHNWTSNLKEGKLKLIIDGKTYFEKKLEIPAKTLLPQKFSINLPPSSYKGFIKLDIEDDLKEDNFWFLSFSTFSPIKVLCIDGHPSKIKYLDSAYYLSLALNPEEEKNFYLQPVVIDKITDKLNSYPVIFLLEYPEFNTKEVSLLKNFLNSGGNLIIATGKNISLDNYNRMLSYILPADLISYQEGNFNVKDTPIFSLSEKLKERVIFRSIISAKEKKDSHILLYFSGGYPALLERKFGKGTVYLFTSTLSLSETDFPLTPYYLPFIHEFISRISPSSEIKNYLTGKPISLPSFKREYTIIEPQGKEIKVKKTFIPLIPGIYYVKEVDRNFAVNCNRMESNLERLNYKEIKMITSGKISPVKDRGRTFQKGEWGNILLIVGLFILGMESILANSFLPSEREKRKIFLRRKR